MSPGMEGGPAHHRPPEATTAKQQARGDSRTVRGQKNAGGVCDCSECGRVFTGLTGFDAHSLPEHPNGTAHSGRCGCSDWWPRCATASELEAKGYAPDAHGRWGTGSTRGRWSPAETTQTAVDPTGREAA
jgi:hypothetical protein